MRSWIAIGFYFIVSLNLLIAQESIDLSGNWKVKVGNQKEKQVSVPGLAGDAKKSESVIYKKSVQLPKGKWNRAVLELNGARFDPSVTHKKIIYQRINCIISNGGILGDNREYARSQG